MPAMLVCLRSSSRQARPKKPSTISDGLSDQLKLLEVGRVSREHLKTQDEFASILDWLDQSLTQFLYKYYYSVIIVFTIVNAKHFLYCKALCTMYKLHCTQH